MWYHDLHILASRIFGDCLVTVCSVLIMVQGKRIHVVQQGGHLSHYAHSRNRIFSELNFVQSTCAWLRVLIRIGPTDVIVLWICHGFGFDEKGHWQRFFSAIAFLVTYRCPFFVPFVMLYIKGSCTILEEKYRATYALMDVLFLCVLGDVLH